MSNLRVIYKPRVWDGILFSRLKELEESLKDSNKNFITYSYLRSKLCRNFSINKQELKKVLEELGKTGLIELSSIGIKLRYTLEND